MLLEHIDISELSVPRHVAVIMDGNGRWAKQRGLPRAEGHIKGQDALRTTLRAAAEFGVKVLTVYAFSTENWSRPQEEVDALMELLVHAIHTETPQLIKEGVRLMAIGDTSRLPEMARASLTQCLEETAHCSRITLVLALSYSSRDELVRSVQHLAHRVAEGSLVPQAIDETLVSASLDTAELPELDLMIRTGGESRISNFLLWQAAYAELYFSSCYWPDFGREELLRAIVDYSQRERRFGKTSEQILLED
ncbi:MAG: isoprenyl transferase [Porphyromonadaceae bacterium]|nr:isoprenyl transferase [Porphyromonadaceae bacterium]